MRVLVILILTIGNLLSQSKIIDLNDIPLEISFNADKIKVSSTGYYLLDSDYKQLMYISNDIDIYTAGGYGNEFDAFLDPIDILVYNLNVYVVDGTDNKIVIYDHKLNYVRTIDIDDIYPTRCGIDDWGNILIYSEIENKLFKLVDGTNTISEFIDLSIYNINAKSVVDIYGSSNGKIAILSKDTFSVFNRLGSLEYKLPILNQTNFIFFDAKQWYGIDGSNNILNLKNPHHKSLLFDGEIGDIDHLNNGLYILSNNQIWVVNADLE